MIAGTDIKAGAAKEAGLTILKTLAYFDIFDYPLSKKEIKSFLGHSIDDAVFEEVLRQLIFRKVVFVVDGFYALENSPQKVQRRLDGNMRARKLLPTAGRIGAFLYKFPYVRGVAVSGSLSKNYADRKADIDFFIITKANRLWIARTILHLFKKTTFLLGRQHYYCMNYFIDEDAVMIPEKNIYTATEVITLLPVAGSDTMKNFFEVNHWSDKWYPVYADERTLAPVDNPSVFKKITESIFNGNVGDYFDNFLFRLTSRRWKKKETLEMKNSKGKIMNLVTGKHFSKSDPEAFQQKIVNQHQHKIEQLKARWLNSD